MRFENASKRNQICPTRFRDKRETDELLPLSFCATKGKEEKQKPAQYGWREAIIFRLRERCCGAKKKKRRKKKREKKSGKKMEEQKEEKEEKEKEKEEKEEHFGHNKKICMTTTTTTTTKTKRIQTQTLSSSR